MIHNLKIWPIYFKDIENRKKTFEYRKDDRGFLVNDILVLQEFMAGKPEECYTGKVALRKITHITKGNPLPAGYCIMSIIPLKEDILNEE